MPVLPSGRRIEFSLDRFHALLGQMDMEQAFIIADALHDPDDLLLVLDAVHFSLESGKPYFAGYVAADWETRVADWNTEDRNALRAWFASDSARFHRAEAIESIKALLLEMPTDYLPRHESVYSQLSI
ncbi:MAG: hypothetical protein M0Q22_10675 [Sulfuritalea sp.]|jgi:hypothetical protein|nr:hypothetical protein [Sulfuritalea sp.]